MPPTRAQRRERDVTAEIQGRYAAEALALLREYGVRVCHWRSSMSGIAWVGNPRRPIEAPHPRSPLSFAVLAHEVGHHALGRVRPRWREEYLAWEFALEQMRRRGVPIDRRVRERYAASMRYALAKALRRGLKAVPPELLPFVLPDA
ncbi:MAG: hypothetical protein QJR03_10440 [Sphaerobacter sp.]|nr:hypothetical protein [Sphaerobacter sp.]